MTIFTVEFTVANILNIHKAIDDWFFILAFILFILECFGYLIKKQLSKNLLKDSFVNFITLTLFIAVVFVSANLYLYIFNYTFDNFSIVTIPITLQSIICCLILADLAYYFEHRFLHSCGIGWATHITHHSSKFFNISVAYRFGPLDWFFPIFFYLPLAVLGFNPFLIFFCEMLVQIYQTLLHTKSIKKLPKPIEAIFNTPSHHRVHHGRNKEYLDKNYAGIFIIWDKLFGTFAKENQEIKFGVFPQIKSFNPFYVFFTGYITLIKKIYQAKTLAYKWNLLTKSPLYIFKKESKKNL